MSRQVQKTIEINYNQDKVEQNSFFSLVLYNKGINQVVKGNPTVKYRSVDSALNGEWPSTVIDGEIHLFTKDFPDIKNAGTYNIIVYLENGEIYPSSGHAQLTLENQLPNDPSQVQVIKGIDGKDGKSVSTEEVKELVNDAVKEIPKIKGDKGDKGESAFQQAVDDGFLGTEKEWLESLKGKDGKDGTNGKDGKDGTNGKDGESIRGARGEDGDPGMSAYQIAVNNGFVGSEREWLDSLRGESIKGDKGDKGDRGESIKGDPGKDGKDGKDGQRGKSAYEVARDNGYPGDIDDWLQSLKGEKGDKGDKGDSAYEEAVSAGFQGTESEWLISLKGDKGDPGESIKGDRGDQGLPGDKGAQGAKGDKGDTGNSAYQEAQANGFQGTELEWLNSLKGAKGDKGDPGKDGESITGPQGVPGIPGRKGDNGLSAYEVAVSKGFQGSESEWLESLKGGAKGDKGDKGDPGDRGQDGKSAYQVAREHGFDGSQEEWLASLKGEKGDKGDKGDPGTSIDTSIGYVRNITANSSTSPETIGTDSETEFSIDPFPSMQYSTSSLKDPSTTNEHYLLDESNVFYLSKFGKDSFFSVPLTTAYVTEENSGSPNSTKYPLIQSYRKVYYFGVTPFIFNANTVNLADNKSKNIILDVLTYDVYNTLYGPNYDEYATKNGDDKTLDVYDTDATMNKNNLHGIITQMSYTQFKPTRGVTPNYRYFKLELTIGWNNKISTSAGTTSISYDLDKLLGWNTNSSQTGSYRYERTRLPIQATMKFRIV